MSPRSRAYVSLLFNLAHQRRDEHFGNARYVRNIFEETVARHSQRSVSSGASDKEALQTIEHYDVPIDAVAGVGVRAIDLSPALWKGSCHRCQKAFTARMDVLGRRDKCKNCAQDYVVPWDDLVLESIAHITRGMPIG